MTTESEEEGPAPSGDGPADALRRSFNRAKGAAPPGPVVTEISVLGSFLVRVGGTVLDLPEGSQRVLAFLALHDRVISRAAMAGTLWPEVSDQRAAVSLRSALSRLDGLGHEVIVLSSAGVRLTDAVTLDFRVAALLAHRLLQPGAEPSDGDLSDAAVAALALELLPDWYDDWVVTEAEDWRQLRMNGLEAQARLLTARGDLAGAAQAARAAMRASPLRESAHASLIRVHLAEGNQSEALRVFDRYRALLQRELGLEPTAILSDLIASIRS